MDIYMAAIIQVAFLLNGCASNIHEMNVSGHVSNLINQMTLSEKSGTEAFSELESMGTDAVPYLICHLDDMRPVAMKGVTLENKSPGAFEALRHYGPKTIHDAVAAILNQTTHKSFLSVYNGATKDERIENQRRWMEWYESTGADYPEPCK